MRIGTWNLDRCPSSTSEKGQEVAARLDELKADLWMLTEVHRDWDPRGGTFAVSPPRGFDPDAPKRWAGVETSLPLTAIPSQGEHPGEEGLVLARVAVDGRDVLVACSVLPWKDPGELWPGLPDGHQFTQFDSVLQHHVERIRAERRQGEPLVWGGDFNQSLQRPVDGGTVKGMTALQSAFESLRLVALTVDAEHRKGHMRSIDHLAISEHFTAGPAEIHRLTRSDGRNLSDHAAYTADVELTGPDAGSGPTAVATRDEASGWTSWAGVPGFRRKGEQSSADVDDLDEQSSVARAGQELVERLLRTGIDGFGPFKPAAQSAREALEGRTPDQAVTALVRNHCAMAGAQGFVTNVGGLVTLPITLPANVGASYLVQAHLAASIAAAHGHDLGSEQMRSAILLCLLGNAGTEILKRAGVTVGTKMSTALIKRIPVTVIREINKRAGFALVAKFGTKRAALTLAKGVPVVGGVIGGGFDVVATRAVGAFADRVFRPAETANAPTS